MAVDTISKVTDAIIVILQNALNASGFFGIINVTPDLPVRQDAAGLGFYLYHMLENAQYKNASPVGNDSPPVNFTPMGLNLYYQLCANDVSTDGKSSIQEQKMMSVAMKALHDNAQIDISTDDKVRISLQPVAPNEAVHNWTAGSYPLKLSAYYEVSVVFLIPEMSKSYSGRVITYGNYIFTNLVPRIIQSQNTISFRIPGEFNDRQVTVQPAQATFGDAIDFIGSGFTGLHLQLLLVHNGWNGNALADKTAWNYTLTGAEKLTVTVQKTALLQSTGLPITLLPGMYGAQINAPHSITFPDGNVRNMLNASNIFPFTITPQIGIVVGPVGGVVTVTGYIFIDPVTLLPVDNLQIYIGDTMIQPKGGGPFIAGTYQINSATQLQLFIPAALAPGTILPMRILIGGAESRPIWITV